MAKNESPLKLTSREQGDDLKKILKELQLIRGIFVHMVPLLTKITNSIAESSTDEGTPQLLSDIDMYEIARKAVLEEGSVSTLYLQRKLGIGYALASRLIDQLEENGVVAPVNGFLPRNLRRPLTPEAIKTLSRIEKLLKKKKKSSRK